MTELKTRARSEVVYAKPARVRRRVHQKESRAGGLMTHKALVWERGHRLLEGKGLIVRKARASGEERLVLVPETEETRQRGETGKGGRDWTRGLGGRRETKAVSTAGVKTAMLRRRLNQERGASGPGVSRRGSWKRVSRGRYGEWSPAEWEARVVWAEKRKAATVAEGRKHSVRSGIPSARDPGRWSVWASWSGGGLIWGKTWIPGGVRWERLPRLSPRAEGKAGLEVTARGERALVETVDEVRWAMARVAMTLDSVVLERGRVVMVREETGTEVVTPPGEN